MGILWLGGIGWAWPQQPNPRLLLRGSKVNACLCSIAAQVQCGREEVSTSFPNAHHPLNPPALSGSHSSFPHRMNKSQQDPLCMIAGTVMLPAVVSATVKIATLHHLLLGSGLAAVSGYFRVAYTTYWVPTLEGGSTSWPGWVALRLLPPGASSVDQSPGPSAWCEILLFGGLR